VDEGSGGGGRRQHALNLGAVGTDRGGGLGAELPLVQRRVQAAAGEEFGVGTGVDQALLATLSGSIREAEVATFTLIARRNPMSAPDERRAAAVAAVVAAIRGGNLVSLRRLIDEQPDLPIAWVNGRTALHVVADWPGYFPNGPAVVRMLVAAGADPNACTEGGAPETPLHWAASSDDLDVADALIDAGADLETPGGSIGTPLDNAIGYGCWHVARRLVERGARVDKLWHAAALGLLPRVEELLGATPVPGRQEISEAFWQACHGGQRRTAEHLLRHGADINAVPAYAKQTALAVAVAPDTRRDLLATWLRDQGARPSTDTG
jgi:hypothetical protein